MTQVTTFKNESRGLKFKLRLTKNAGNVFFQDSYLTNHPDFVKLFQGSHQRIYEAFLALDLAITTE